ncbi:uncharacterized protein LOC127729024 [Mytilus californianus]|uniref:uncharacterized protein LOC127729024 n=1 Tax=Mytilus californianus TaxID=6549 RepID=UPI0022465AF2|nr:uncharacterized protein LOC127729024 [Mytilus californianus]
MKLPLVLALCITGLLAGDVKQKRSSTTDHISSGLNAAKDIASVISNSTAFATGLVRIADKVAPFLGVVAPFISFVFGFIPKGPSAELLAIRNLHKDIDTRFDQVDRKFSDVKQLINWSSVKVQFSSIEQKINAVYRKYREMYQAPTNALAGEKQLFISNYESDFQNSGIKLYDGVLNVGRVFGDGLLVPCMTYTKYDRRKCSEFSSGILNLLLKSAELELAYLQLKGLSSNVDYHAKQWKTRIDQVRSAMSHADRTIASKYHDQSNAEIDRYALDHPGDKMNNHDWANNMYNSLSRKYYWRDWMVISYKDVTGDDKHWNKVCGGYSKFRNHGRNILIASVDKRTRHLDNTKAHSVVNAVHDHTSSKGHCRPHCGTVYHRIDSHTAYDTFPAEVKDHCSPYVASGVIYNDAQPSYKAAANRLVLRNDKFNHIHVFG